MPNRRTVDPDGTQASVRTITLRVTERQLLQMATLCSARNVKRSRLLRELVQKAWDEVPEPF